VEKDEFIWVWIGDADKADASLIVDYPYHNDYQKWPHKHEVYRVKANYMLMVDKPDGHDASGLRAQEHHRRQTRRSTSRRRWKSRPRKNGLHFIRWMLDCKPPPSYSKAVTFNSNVDRWQEFEFFAPGAIVQWSGAPRSGPRRAAGARPARRLFAASVSTGSRPETDGTCFYFWSTANGYKQDDPQATEALFKEIGMAFDEDKTNRRKSSRRRWARTGEENLIDIISDRARVHMRRIVQRLAREAEAAP